MSRRVSAVLLVVSVGLFFALALRASGAAGPAGAGGVPAADIAEVTGNGKEVEGKSPPLASRHDGSAGKNAAVVYFGVIPRDNPRIAYGKYQPIMDYLSDATPYRFELVLKRSYEDTLDAIGSGEIDVAFLGPLTYLNAYTDFGVIPIAKNLTEKGEPFYRSVIVARNNSPIKRLEDLRDKSFAFASMKSTSGNLIPRYLLVEQGIHLRDLNSYRNFNYHDSVAKWILKGKYDAGAVRDSVAEKYMPLGLKVIAASRPIPTGPVVVEPGTSPELVGALRKALLAMNQTEKGVRVLKKTDPELRGGFIPVKHEDYEELRKMINDVPQTCGLRCHPDIKL